MYLCVYIYVGSWTMIYIHIYQLLFQIRRLFLLSMNLEDPQLFFFYNKKNRKKNKIKSIKEKRGEDFFVAAVVGEITWILSREWTFSNSGRVSLFLFTEKKKWIFLTTKIFLYNLYNSDSSVNSIKRKT